MFSAEVLRLSSANVGIIESIDRVTVGPRNRTDVNEDGNTVEVFHRFLPSARPFHKATRQRTEADGSTTSIPREVTIKRQTRFLYDVVVAQCDRHVVVAVPFHGLARAFFPQFEREYAGTGTVYERLDITQMVLRVGAKGTIAISTGAREQYAIGLTQCHLAYADPSRRTRDVEHVRLVGENLGVTPQYKFLVDPVIHPKPRGLLVSPVSLGFALHVDGTKKVSAITDRHGNFRLYVGAGLRQVRRLFSLLRVLETVEDVVSTTVNLPILQSRLEEE
jgi:hypothetical protein